MDKKGLIQGYVVLKHNGKVVYDDYNTITTKGREFILATITKNALLNIPSIEQGDTEFLDVTTTGETTTITDNYHLSGIGFGYGTSDTGSATIKLVNDYIFSLNDTDAIQEQDIDFNSNFIKYTLEINATDSNNVAVSELGLYLTRTGTLEDVADLIRNGKGILFSRISFDPIPMVPSTKLTLDYYIYF